MMSTNGVKLKLQWGLTASDPQEKPVLIVGQASHLQCIGWNAVKCKIEPRADKNAWSRAMSLLTGAQGDSCEIWPQAVTVASLPLRCSRHNAPSRCHALAKIVHNFKFPQSINSGSIVLVCTKRDVYASVLAIARSFPLYSAKTASSVLSNNVPVSDKDLTVEIQLVQESEESIEAEMADGDSVGAAGSALREASLTDGELALLNSAVTSVRLAARLADTPTCYMDVDQFIQEACAVAKELEIAEPTIIRGEELKARGMGGLYGVGRAAACPPALVVLSYCAPGATQSVAWVGKGIVYDTGGLSIKNTANMVGMKGDCAGAAGVLGAFAVTVRAKPCINLHAVLCLAENAVGPLATRPDDIHVLYSGKSVEINNTDAEGRLVLSDGVVYAHRDLKADTIVDVATLTGAQATATGKYHAALVCNRAALERAAAAAGRAAGELAHALPFCPEMHYPEFSSALADMKNSCADRANAQVSCAGLFILSHLGFDFKGRWLHIDMAAPASSGERATGYGVGILPVLFGSHTQNTMLQALSPGPVL